MGRSGKYGSSTLVVAGALALAAPALAQDSDGDGVANAADALPCDASAAAIAYAPGQGVHGLAIFEDEWPYTSDFDANDVVIGYHFELRADGQGQAVLLRVTLSPLALGGELTNGLGLHLPVARGAVASANLRVGAGQPASLAPTMQDAEATFIVADDLRSLFGGVTGPINSLPDQPRRTGQTVQLDVTFAPGTTLGLGAAPFDLFIRRFDLPTHEIHFPGYGGTANMNATLFGQGLDGSTTSRRFVFAGGLPAALLLPDTTPYPAEQTPLEQLFPNIVEFAASGGAAQTDFYATSVNQSAAYRDVDGVGAPRPEFLTNPAIDTSCVPTAIAQVPNFSGETGPDYSNEGYQQCAGYLDRPNSEDIPNSGWADDCIGPDYDSIRLACGTGPDSVRYIDVSRNIFSTGLDAYSEQGLITGSNFSVPQNIIYANGNQPNSGTSWWGAGNGCGEGNGNITINNSCSWEASNCFGQNISGQRYLYVYVGVNHCADGVLNYGETAVDCGAGCTRCPTCSDGIQNNDETGLDCGGSCGACPSCSDNVQNQGEAGVDCGGPCSNPCPPVVPGFGGGRVGPQYSGWTQCAGYLDQANSEDIPNSGWADSCRNQGFTRIRLACGANSATVRYLDVGRNIFDTGLNAYSENGLIVGSNFSYPQNIIYANGNQPNSGTSWWGAGNGCGEGNGNITINNSCSWEASNCFGQNISGARYLFVYGQ